MKKRLIALLLSFCTVLPLGLSADTAEAGKTYSDVPANAWYAGAVAYVTEKGLMKGTDTDASTFSPNEPTNLAMVVTILHRDAGAPAATGPAPAGVPAGNWYAEAAAWAEEAGLLRDVNRTFTGVPISREDLVTVLWRYAGTPAGNGADFADEGDISAYAAQAVDWSRAGGVVNGKPGNLFDPKGGATRAELATILQNFMENIAQNQPEGDQTVTSITIKIGTRSFTATLADTEAAKTFAQRLPMTVTMDELNGNEKYHYLDGRLPAASRNPGTIRTGDLMLYGSTCLVLFYQSFSTSYSYTPLGQIDDPAGLAEAVGQGSVQVTFEAR